MLLTKFCTPHIKKSGAEERCRGAVRPLARLFRRFRARRNLPSRIGADRAPRPGTGWLLPIVLLMPRAI